MASQSIDDVAGGIGTLPDARSDADAIKARNWRRVGLVTMWLLVAAGLTGFLGVRMATTSATANGWTIDVKAPQITRGALDSPITITISREDGFRDSITLRVDRTLYTHIDANLVVPAPSAETGTADEVKWMFDAPDGDVLTITIDARMSPAQMPGIDRLGFAVVERGEVVVEVRPRLILLP